MFKLRQAHLDAFEAQVVELFTKRVIEHVTAVWSAECNELGKDLVLNLVRDAIKSAVKQGFSTEYDVVRFVSLTFLLGPGFETNPLSAWVKPILLDRSLLSEVRMDRLYQRMHDQFSIIERRQAPKP